MWALNTVLTTRVYMNLVWLTKRPFLDTTLGPLSINTGPSIRMRVHVSTEIEPDRWLATFPSSAEGIERDGRVVTHIK